MPDKICNCSDTEKAAYLAKLAAAPEKIRLLQAVASSAYDLWIGAMDGKYSPDEIVALIQQGQDRLYATADNTKTAVAGFIAAAGAIINVIPVIGQIISVILEALAAIIKFVPVARGPVGPNFSYQENATFATYRGFTRYFMILQECHSTNEGKEQGFAVGGPGTPDYCNTGQMGGLILKNKHIDLVNRTLINLGKYLEIPNILSFFPEGPAAKNPSWQGDRSPALFIIEAFKDIPPYESLSPSQRKDIVNKLIDKVDFKSSVKNNNNNNNNNNVIIYAILGIATFVIVKNKKNRS